MLLGHIVVPVSSESTSGTSASATTGTERSLQSMAELGQCSGPSRIRGLTLAPDTDPLEKIKQLEEQISVSLLLSCILLGWLMASGLAHLKTRLYEQDMASSSVSPHQPSNMLYTDTTMSPPSTSSRALSDVGGISLPRASLSLMTPNESPELRFRSQSRTPENLLNNLTNRAPPQDPFMDLLFLGWNSDLPDPATLNH
ncbi:hypothetical protein DXG01_000137 [Tephrocybe rancida]|nr:hypothetical protein DXG01_000137 [Tephrocybe rancida]